MFQLWTRLFYQAKVYAISDILVFFSIESSDQYSVKTVINIKIYPVW